jgi:hypothetical protein
MTKLLFPLALLAPLLAQAHEGHGLTGPHGHATDAWGFAIGALAVAGAALWWRGRK